MGVLVIPEGKTILFRVAIFIGLGSLVTTIIYLTPVPAMDSSCGTLVYRSSIVVGLATAVVTILYFTPLPDQYPQSCSRQCHELDWPMICRVKLTLERYQTLGNACKDCPHNKTDCYQQTCITVDGQVKGILAANRQFPGPNLEVCQNDIIVVDIVNRIPGQSFGVHWRGQPQSETPYMDGVPMVTQCPIPSFTTFQYKFRASESGTHMWQVNTGEEILNTLFGALIVRKPDSKETHRELYDTDHLSNVVVIHPWNPHRSTLLFEENTSKIKLLINGKTQENGVPPTVFKVSSGKSHRFRVVYMGGTKICKIRLSIDNHNFLVIALDGHSIKPKMVRSAILFPGERLDFVLRTDQQIGSYHLRVTPIESCTTLLPTTALIQYDEENSIINESVRENESSRREDVRELKGLFDEDCFTKDNKSVNVCLHDVQGAKPIPEEISIDKPNAKFYFFYDSAVVSSDNLYNTTLIAIEDSIKVPRTNNLTMMLPSFPLLTQYQQITSDSFCNEQSKPMRCKNSGNNICECVHIQPVPLNDIVELVLVNQDDNDHVIHLHGYSFHVIGASKLPAFNLKPHDVKHLDELNSLVERNFDFPIIKDTVAVANNSVVIIRFKADNPGFWLLDEEHSSPWSRGMSLVLRVGRNSDLSPTPQNFPKCGDWIGPEFFLT